MMWFLGERLILELLEKFLLVLYRQSSYIRLKRAHELILGFSTASPVRPVIPSIPVIS